MIDLDQIEEDAKRYVKYKMGSDRLVSADEALAMVDVIRAAQLVDRPPHEVRFENRYCRDDCPDCNLGRTLAPFDDE